MPGGRLSQQERQQIAAGLADGLAYAEIARQLDRPTSTVTREVMRNGGPGGYRAELAHHATERRSRQRRQTPARGETPVQPEGRDAEAVRAYEETLTTVFIQSGLAKMMSRVLAAIFVSDSGTRTAAELAQHLEVSPATISKSIAFLESQDLVRRERDDRRRERYSVDNELWYQSTIASAKANLRLAEIARQGGNALGASSPAAVRLENVARFLDFVSEAIVRSAEQARDVLFTKPDQDQDVI